VSAAPLEQIPVGVVVERRKAESPWVDYTWRVATVLPGVPEAAPWTQLSTSGDAASFYVGTAVVALFRTETAHYRDNLASGTPTLWVMLRPTGVNPPYDLAAVTADPAEGEAFTQSGDCLVDAVPMHEVVRVQVEAFVTKYHVEIPFVKRKRDDAEPKVMARSAPPPNDEPR
jgi:hypothetical protein